MIEISKKLIELISRCDHFEELPHSFDDTLVDKLISQICLKNDVFVQFFDDLIKSTSLCESSSVNVSLIIRLIEKFCVDERFSKDKLIYFISECDKLLEQERPPKVSYDLLHFYTRAFYVVENEQIWKQAVQWCLKSLKEPNLSIFVLREISVFLDKFSVCEVHLFVKELISAFSKSESVHVRNCIASLISKCITDVPIELRCQLLHCIQSSTGLGDAAFILGAKIIAVENLQHTFEKKNWTSEFACIEVMIKYIQASESTDQSFLSCLMDALSTSKYAKLRHYVTVVPYLSNWNENVFDQWFSTVAMKLQNRKFAPLSELNSFINMVMETIGEAATFRTLDYLPERLVESPCIMQSVHQKYGDRCLAAHENVNSTLSNFIQNAVSDISEDSWDVRDTAVEIAYLFPALIGDASCLPDLVNDSSPYIRAATLRLLIKIEYESEVLMNSAEKILLHDVDPEPRIEAGRYLLSQMPNNLKIACSVYLSLLQDTDIDLRRLGLELASFLLDSAEFSSQVKHDLEDWKEDVEVGERVRDLLGVRGQSPTEDPTIHLLTDMLSSLDVSVDDTLDCY